MKKYYVLVDIGCIECGEESNVIGIFRNKERAEKELEQHYKDYNDYCAGQHHFEIFERNIDVTYNSYYRKETM